jgi:hypothetical protein
MVEKFSEDTSTPRNDPQVWLQVMDQILIRFVVCL